MVGELEDRLGVVDVFPAHLASGGKAVLSALTAEEVEALSASEGWLGREQEQPLLRPLVEEPRGTRTAGFALNAGSTDTGVTAVGRVVRTGDDDLRAAVSVSLPSTRFSRDTVTSIVREQSSSTAGIEKAFARKAE